MILHRSPRQGNGAWINPVVNGSYRNAPDGFMGHVGNKTVEHMLGPRYVEHFIHNMSFSHQISQVLLSLQQEAMTLGALSRVGIGSKLHHHFRPRRFHTLEERMSDRVVMIESIVKKTNSMPNRPVAQLGVLVEPLQSAGLEFNSINDFEIRTSYHERTFVHELAICDISRHGLKGCRLPCDLFRNPGRALEINNDAGAEKNISHECLLSCEFAFACYASAPASETIEESLQVSAFSKHAGTPPYRVGWGVLQHDRIGSNGHVIANSNWAENGGAGANVAVIANDRHIVVATSASNCHILAYDAILSNACPAMDHHANALVAERSALTNLTRSRNKTVVNEVDPHFVDLRQGPQMMVCQPMSTTIFVNGIHKIAHEHSFLATPTSSSN